MSGTNKIVTSTVNVVSWEISRSSYEAAKKKILSLRQLTAKPAKALEKAQKRTVQSEGKAALAAAKAQTAKLRQAEQLSKQQQKQAKIQAKMERDAIAHANKMTSLQARQLSQQEQAARQSARLAAISAKVQAAARSRVMTYNPDMGGNFAERGLLERQNAAMLRGHGAVAADIAAQKRALALEEKKEAALKREVAYYNSLRKSALTLANVNGADVATRYKAIRAAKEALKAQKEERFTVEETRFEMARITTELRKQARLQQRITREQKAGGVRAGRVRTEGRGGLAAAGVIAGGSLIGSMGVARVGQTLQGSLERSREAQQLKQYDISQLEFNAIHDVVQKRTGYDLTVDKYASMNKDYFEKAGELLNTGSFKTNKQGVTTFSGGGELAGLVNAVLSKTNQRTAQKVIGELQKLDMGTFVTFVRQLGKQFNFTEREMRFFLEAIDDGSVLMAGISGEGDEVIARMRQLAAEGWTLSDAQQANLEKLSALSTEYSRVQTSLADHFSASFVAGLGEYGQNTDNLSKGMAGLIPITNELGKSLGEMSAVVLKITSWFGGINPENKHEQLSDNGLYYKDSMVGRVWQSFKNSIEGITSASTIPGVQGMPSQSNGSGTAFNNPALALNVPGLNYQTLQPQQPTFTVPTIDSLAKQQPIPVSVTGQANINQQMDVFVHDDKIAGLVDTKIRENNQAQNNLILGIAQ